MTLLAFVFAATLSAGNAEFDASANLVARDIAIARLQGETVEKGLPEGVLERTMLAEPAKFAHTNDAVRFCRAVYAEALERQYHQAADDIVRQLGLDATPTNGLPETVEKAVNARFAAAYASERASAVAAQAKTIAGAVKPDEAEFESKDEATLRREMTAKVAAGQHHPVFDENLRYISEKIVDPVIADGRREMKRQLEYLSRTKCESYAPEALAREIEGNLQKDVAKRRAKETDPAKMWGVFPRVVREGIPPVVERRVTGLVTKSVDDVKILVDGESVLKTIAADPEAHRKAADSEKVFRAAYAAQILGGAVEKATQEAPENERVAFAEFARSHLAASDLTKSVEARLKREVLPQWRKTRDEVAKAEADRLWPTLANRTWFPEAELADRMAARSDYAAAVKAWRETPELEALAKADGGKPVMEETAADADKSVSAAFDLARSAITAQNTILTEVEPSVLKEARDRQSSFWRTTPDFQAIVNLLTQAVETNWGERRLTTLWREEGDRPANADEQHAALFPSVKRRIELVARSILEEMKKPEPEPEQKPEPEEPPPEDPIESEQQSEEPQVMKFSILVERTGDTVTVKLEQGESTVERSAKAKMTDYQGAMKFVSDKLGTDILKLK